ncbi:MAG: hypothetical protein ACREF9_06215 [Opitutaceae bacterium]
MKRAERPPADFWANFDRKLRAKQLAALVGKRPWWQRLSAAFSRVSRYRVALGAGAVVAITFFSVRDSQDTPQAPEVQTDARSIAIADAPVEPSVAFVEPAALQAEFVAVTVLDAQPESVMAAPSVAVAAKTEEPARSIPPGGALSPESDREVLSPSARQIAANLAIVQSSEPLSARRLLDVATGFEARAMPVRAAVEPLQQMASPSDTRRSRLLTAMVSTASMDASVRTTSRAASRIEEERLYDQIRRFGARGDSVHVKF